MYIWFCMSESTHKTDLLLTKIPQTSVTEDPTKYAN